MDHLASEPPRPHSPRRTPMPVRHALSALIGPWATAALMLLAGQGKAAV